MTAPRIISASRRTDLPAYYGKWFENRIKAGFCEYRTAFSAEHHRVSLLPEDVAGFVFWTRNARPFLPVLRSLAKRKWPYVCHYTLTGLPRRFEPRRPEVARSLETMKAVADVAGPDTLLWRYDPIVVSAITPADWHLKHFEILARSLEGVTEQVLVSFVEPYLRTVEQMPPELEIKYRRPDPERHKTVTKRHHPKVLESAKALELLEIMQQCAAARGIRLSVCSNDEFVTSTIPKARCVDRELFESVWGLRFETRAAPSPSRPGCACHESRDIGAPDSCPTGCLYCYANHRAERARENHRTRHNPDAPWILGPK